MSIFREKTLGEITAWEAGWSPLGRPFMTVHLFLAGGVLVDTGLRHMRASILEALRTRSIHTVLLTHHHEDHSGNAAALQRETGAPVLAHPGTAEKMRRAFPILPYQHLIWGRSEPAAVTPCEEPVDAGSLSFVPVHTPGHSRDHTAYLVPERGWLFAGDLYLADRVKYFRADERIADEITSLRKVLALDFEALLCAHNPRPHRGKARIAAKLRFLENVFGEVGRLRDRGLGERAVLRKLGLGEVRSVQWMTGGNVSARNIVRSALRDLETSSP
ncbi:MAG: MBL fold metallo-hydrolase [Deltaproteobacteria bacterium]|nr:MBL fold metallo-hydrolase [Deltaproteobacteria bacterium]